MDEEVAERIRGVIVSAMCGTDLWRAALWLCCGLTVAKVVRKTCTSVWTVRKLTRFRRFCPAVMYAVALVMRHRLVTRDGRTCPICGSRFDSLRALMVHISGKHRSFLDELAHIALGAITSRRRCVVSSTRSGITTVFTVDVPVYLPHECCRAMDRSFTEWVCFMPAQEVEKALQTAGYSVVYALE